MPFIAQTACGIDQLSERGLFEPNKKCVIARITHRNHLWRYSACVPATPTRTANDVVSLR